MVGDIVLVIVKADGTYKAVHCIKNGESVQVTAPPNGCQITFSCDITTPPIPANTPYAMGSSVTVDFTPGVTNQDITYTVGPPASAGSVSADATDTAHTIRIGGVGGV